jgi:hypothetical protein
MREHCPPGYLVKISTMFSASMSTDSLSPKKKMMCRSLGAPNSLASLKEYLAPLERRTPNGRKGWRSTSCLISLDFTTEDYTFTPAPSAEIRVRSGFAARFQVFLRDACDLA